MTTLKRLVVSFALVYSLALVCPAQEQQQPSPSAEVTADSYQVRFAVRGEAASLRVEVFSPSGEKVFDSGAVFGQDVAWDMTDGKGGRVTEGVYLANITVTDATGKAQSRVEQIVINGRDAGHRHRSFPAAPGHDHRQRHGRQDCEVYRRHGSRRLCDNGEHFKDRDKHLAAYGHAASQWFTARGAGNQWR
jgi:hypothetical protein